MTRLHDDELSLDVLTAAQLIATGMPELAALPVTPASHTGSSNFMFAVGDRYLARFPRQPGGSASIAKEARWLSQIGQALSVATPEIIYVGGPGLGYPECWSIMTRLPGRNPTPQAGSSVLADDLVTLVEQIRAIPVTAAAAADLDLRWYRGGPLGDLDEDFTQAVRESEGMFAGALDYRRAERIWSLARQAEQDCGRAFFHGDLLAENLLVGDGDRLSAVLDFGGLGIGDPTVDLIVAWEVLDAPSRTRFREALEIGEATWAISKGWALLIAMITFPCYGHTMPARTAARMAMARAVIDGS